VEGGVETQEGVRREREGAEGGGGAVELLLERLRVGLRRGCRREGWTAPDFKAWGRIARDDEIAARVDALRVRLYVVLYRSASVSRF
jgi:hypothetical protein